MNGVTSWQMTVVGANVGESDHILNKEAERQKEESGLHI
jgi:hypothetical protein